MKSFYYDIVCPYAYMAFSYLHRQNAFRDGLKLKPILLGGLFKLMEQEVDPNQSMSLAKKDYLKTDIMRQASYFGAHLSFHARHPLSSLKAMRLLVSCPDEVREPLTARLYQAYWQENLDIDNEQVIEKIAREFSVGLPNEKAKEQLIRATKDAFENKVFGVPSFIIDDELFFGADRMILFQDRLSISLPDCPWKPSTERINFYFDFSSPYSYLAFKEVAKCEANFNFIPVLLGALFRERGINSIPMLSAHPHKAAYYYKDMQDWARFREAEFIFNEHFPVRTVTALRISLLEPRVNEAIFDAVWARNKNIGDDRILVSILNDAGFFGEELLNKSQNEDVKERLKTNTNQALLRGVFGVPTFDSNGQLVFGQDRFSWIRLQRKGLNS